MTSFTEAAVPACSCEACRRPSAANAGLRIDHERAHIGFREYLAGHSEPVLVRKPSLRERTQRTAQEFHVPGRCLDRMCNVSSAHPFHVVKA